MLVIPAVGRLWLEGHWEHWQVSKETLLPIQQVFQDITGDARAPQRWCHGSFHESLREATPQSPWVLQRHVTVDSISRDAKAAFRHLKSRRHHRHCGSSKKTPLQIQWVFKGNLLQIPKSSEEKVLHPQQVFKLKKTFWWINTKTTTTTTIWKFK